MSRLRLLAGLVLLVVVILIGIGSFYTVDEGERAVVTTNGRVVGVAEPGLHFKLPVIQDFHTISLRSNAKLYENVAAYSKDQQTAILQLSVNYKVPPDQVEALYTDFKSEDNVVSRILDRRVLEQTKNVFGRYTAVSAIQERTRLNAEIAQAITAGVTGPLIVESVQVENIDFSDAYEQAVDARMLAEVEVQKLRQNAEREKVQAEITVTEAKATRLRGEADAAAIDARGRALRDNPSVVGLVQAEKWNGVLPTTMVPGSVVPFISLQ